ncbi:MAG: DUF4832 domain-containing protein [Meiothermus sp.]|uniref:DUF4832 domain-containing protein n=1 Tax=Meiothermus sp. TaxID=1955249 RepID=UPI0025F03B22|nr:DUF4832 domain-containing protein [Meiothermus sp.]MCS7194552.1 DUF4832 domain-containing protein [Meiothermus sp.]MCX7740346.1 DUF4832 domain-containing protein [Meiothermus sp.]MDW8091808.1 DUF4832 domain-containing protein [Meiothermus sp.]
MSGSGPYPHVWFSALLVLLLAACGAQTEGEPGSSTGSSSAPLSGKTVTYTTTDEIFLNPERGFRPGVQFGYGIGSRSLAGLDLAGMRGRGYSMIHAYISLQHFQHSDIDPGYIAQLQSRFDEMRRAGLKASVRFWYTWGETTTASRDRILRHIEQLTPLLRNNADVIAVMQAGFAGPWGEWHSYANLSENDLREIFYALARALPQDRRIQLRYVWNLRLFAPGGFGEAEAFDPNHIASRLAHHNDCFMVNQSDAGTYAWDDPQRTADRNYLQGLTRYMAVGGEMCGDVPEAGHDPYGRRTPEGQLAELARFNWSFIANDFGNVDRWRQWGIYDTIARRLGYRLALVESVVQEVAEGRRLRLRLVLRNDGWAAPYNPRPVRLLLRNTQSGQVYSLALNADPRRWYAGSTHTLQVDQALPAGMPAGSYELLLHLPDAAQSLQNRPEYAIRLANPGLWEATTGYNRLNQTVRVP